LKEDIEFLRAEIQDLGQQYEKEEDINIKLQLQRQIREKRSQLARLRTRAKSLGCSM
jgi:hypothetical protein